MSQVVSETAEPLDSGTVDSNLPSEFDYHPVPPLAPISLFLGICSIAGLVGVPGLSIGVVGALVGTIALWQIRRSQGEMGGRVVARIGVWLSIVFVVLGSSYHTYTYATEVPEGYQRVEFNWLSKQPIDLEEKRIQVSPEVIALDGKPIFLKGYMYPTRQKTGITEFVLVKDTGQCCFGGNPKLTDMIVIKFRDGKTVNHREQTLVSVAGYFHAETVTRSGELTAIYSLDGTHFK